MRPGFFGGAMPREYGHDYNALDKSSMTTNLFHVSLQRFNTYVSTHNNCFVLHW